MKTTRVFLLGISAAITVAAIAMIRLGIMPRGVPGEWEWNLVKATTLPVDLILAGFGVLAYAGFVGWGASSLRDGDSPKREAAWLAALVPVAIAVQLVAHAGAPLGYGLTKWITLTQPASSGYLTVARSQMHDPRKFWADYATWIQTQDALHIGTHPPGLFLVSRSVLGLMEQNPGLARGVVDHLPVSVAAGFRIMREQPSQAERASAAMIGVITLLACAGTVVPLYLLARSNLSASSSWASAALWPLAPSAILFHPTADTAFPLLATSALALVSGGGFARAALAGVILGLGMQFTLAFLPVGLAVAIVLAWPSDARSWRRRCLLVLATGAGFAGVTGALWWASGANPLVIWWWNQKNHARFYVVSPKSYWPWIAANTIELGIAIGLPSAVFAVVGYGGRERPPSAWAALIVLTILNLSGKNLSEVARLWLPFMPVLLVAAGAGMARVGGGWGTLAATVAMVGFLTIALEATLQVVYPF